MKSKDLDNLFVEYEVEWDDFSEHDIHKCFKAVPKVIIIFLLFALQV